MQSPRLRSASSTAASLDSFSSSKRFKTTDSRDFDGKRSALSDEDGTRSLADDRLMHRSRHKNVDSEWPQFDSDSTD